MTATSATDPTIQHVFPEGMLKHERWGILVNGLNEHAVPKGTILGSACSKSNSDRVFHMLDCNEERVKLGIFQALPGEEFACYALILERAPLGSREADRMVHAYEDNIKEGHFLAVPKEVHPTIGNVQRFLEQRPQGLELTL